MNIFGRAADSLVVRASTKMAYVLIVAMVLWASGAPTFLNYAKAANITNVSDTLSNSNLSTLSKHTIIFTNPVNNIGSGQTIKVGFDPATSAFSEIGSAATTTDFTVSGLTVVGACVGANQVTVAANLNNGTDENFTFTLCPNSLIATSTATTIVIGAVTKLVTNPAGTGSYRITLGGTMIDNGETRVAVLQNVTLTASVNTSFTFTVTGLATGSTINGTTTSTTSSATALQFGVLSSGTPLILAQQLTVATNARNGFSVTVQEDQPPTSSTGATIDLFLNGATSSTPIAWAAPSSVLDQQWTYGHLGITSDDADLGTIDTVLAANDFTSSRKYAGNIDVPRLVFAHLGPADGTTQNKGKARVGYQIEIGDLQEAGNDYTNTLTYVATPTF